MRKILLIYICLLGAWTLHAQPLGEKLEQLVNHADVLETSEVGISVYNLTRGEPVYRYQDKKLYRPASVEKVITSVTALSRLGADYRFATRLAYTGNITPDGVLDGNLYVVGGFDPEFMESDLCALVQAVVKKGIRAIRGRVVADVSMTDSVHWGTGWAWDDTPESFQPYLSPLMLNRGCVAVTLVPGKRGTAPRVDVSPASDYYRVDNRAESHMPGAGKLKVTRDWVTNGNTIRITGNVSSRTSKLINMYSSKDFFLDTFCYRLRASGVQVASTGFGACPDEALQLSRVEHPLSEVLLRALKKSDNLDAEAMFYALGASGGKKGIGFADAQKEIYHFMHHHIGCSPHRYKVVDGSGVSMYNYLSPELIMEYLRYAYRHKAIFSDFYRSLPVAGVDGTLRNRMKQGPASGRVHAKTGTVTGVSSLAGYVEAAGGDLLAFVIINQNVLKAKEAHSFQDKFCEILAR